MCVHKFVKLVTNSAPVRKFYIEQMFVLVRMQFHKPYRHTTGETFRQSSAMYIRYQI